VLITPSAWGSQLTGYNHHHQLHASHQFPVEFFQKFWDLIKDDLMDMFRSFLNADLPLFRLNYGTIILLPKKENAVQIQQYRPICLLNVSSKFSLRLPRIEFLKLRIK
jgi:hypothetical protein